MNDPNQIAIHVVGDDRKMSDEPTMLDVDLSGFQTMLGALPEGSSVSTYWLEDELFPRDPVEDRRMAIFWFLNDRYGRRVADHWVERGYPEPFEWVEVVAR